MTYSSSAHHAASIRNLEAANAANRARRNFEVWTCAHCGTTRDATVHQLRKKYCSNRCVAEVYKTRLRGESNPNFRNLPAKTCECCGGGFASYDKRRRFCSQECYRKASSPRRPCMKYIAKKDENHHEIIDVLKKCGASVADTSTLANGFPDAIVGLRGENFLVEIKNPKTYYGRKGGNQLQREFAASWQGTIYLLYDENDALKLCSGRLSELRYIGGPSLHEERLARKVSA